MATLYESFTTDASENDFEAAVYLGQTFTPQVTHKLTSVKLKLFRVGGAGGQIGNIFLDIKAVDAAHKPTGGALGTSSPAVVASTLGTASPGAEVEFLFAGTLTLSKDVEYAIVGRTTAGDSSNFVQGRYNASTDYTRGTGWRSTDSGATWVAHGKDWYFKEYGNPLPAAGGGGPSASVLVAKGEI